MINYLRALSFLTVIPLPFVPFSREEGELSRSASCFPLAGLTVGALLGLAAWLLLILLPAAPVSVLVLLLGFMLTRGLHVDGLADTADGLIGTTGREKAFKAMEDSAVGVMGAAVVLLLYLFKFSLLAEGEAALFLPALVLMPFAGRWAIVFAGAFFGSARKKGLGDLFLDGLGWPVLLKASLGGLAVIVLLFFWHPALAYYAFLGSLLALAGAFLLALYASGRLGGISGDILGACSEIGEALFLAGFFIGARYF